MSPSFPATSSTARFSALTLFCAALFYLLPGIIGHDPWKQDETYTFGIIDHLLKTGEWLIPMNAGQPFMEKPPLYMWAASATAWLFSPVLPLHDGARLASALFAAIAFLFAARTAQAAFSTSATAALCPGRDPRIIATLTLLAGTLVVVKHVHDMFSDVALFAGASIALCGLLRVVVALHAVADTKRARASASSAAGAVPPAAPIAVRFIDAVTFGLGVGIAWMSKGVFIPGVFCATVLVLPLLLPYCRNGAYAKAVGMAVAASLPFLLIWPTLLYLTSPADFMTWFWDNNIGRFLGFSVAELGSDNERGLVLKAILTSGFPVWPLAIAGLILGGGWRQLHPTNPGLLVPFVVATIGLSVLSGSATARQLYILPFVLPAALLAVDALDRLPLWISRVWDGSSRLLFGAMAMLVWAIWFLMRQPVDPLALAPTSATAVVSTAAASISAASAAAASMTATTATAATAATAATSFASTSPFDRHQWLAPLGRWLPLDYQLPLEPLGVVVAACLSIAWLLLLPRLAAQRQWRGALSWFMGVTLVWGLVFTLLLPWLDRGKSYGPVFRELAAQVEANWHAGDCMASMHLGESEAPMLAYFSGITHRPIEIDPAAAHCNWMIVQGKDTKKRVSEAQWAPYWQGARQGDSNELLSVYHRREETRTR